MPGGRIWSLLEVMAYVHQPSFPPDAVLWWTGQCFPGTSTVESDVSILQWKKDEYRAHLTNLRLEGVLQFKQSHELLKISH